MSEAIPTIHLLSLLRRRPDAWATVRGSEAYPELSGAVRFYQTRRGVAVWAEVSDLPEAAEPCGNRVFAFHIHGGGQCTGDSADPFANSLTHFNLGNCPHPFHAGDLPPLFSNRGYALQLFLTDRFSVREIIGKTIIIHSGPDDFTTQPGGDAGSKIACGQIKTMRSRSA